MFLNGINIVVHYLLPFHLGFYDACEINTRKEIRIENKVDMIHDKEKNVFYVSEFIFNKLKYGK